MPVIAHDHSKTFHLTNDQVSYIIKILPNGHAAHLYFGKAIKDRDNFDWLFERVGRAMTQNVCEEEGTPFSLSSVQQEFPVYGTTDFREEMIDVLQENGSRISDFQFTGYDILPGKPKLEGLPATYMEEENEGSTLVLHMKDPVSGLEADLLYTIFEKLPVITRSVKVTNTGDQTLMIDRLLSLSLDLPDSDWKWLQLSGAWSRERHVHERDLEPGIVSIGSRRGHSSHEHNPFVILKRNNTDENQGEAIGLSLVYSGNFLMQAEQDAYNTVRLQAGINPSNFTWKLEPGASFQAPEAILTYSDEGLNDLSQSFHQLFQKRLARGYWRDKARPILINNWEATYFNFDEDKLVDIAKKAKECGVELFVLDDGWFGERCNDFAGLGDWKANPDRLPRGIAGAAERINDLGMKFGLWFEPEMVNMDSDLFREHPDWILQTPGRKPSPGRNQYVLDFSRPEIVDEIFNQMDDILSCGRVSYIKWDMNRSITECFSAAYPADQQGEIFHRYILGVYDLYDRLTSKYPEILFESCASGGARFDPGILYYAPQGWTSDDSDAIERLKIQYGTSMAYPISAMGAHVSAVPNHQVLRNTPLKTRANVAYFGTFGYELDLNSLSEEEIEDVKKQIAFMKENRDLFQFGTFYRLKSPFEGNETIWMVVSEDKKKAIVGYYRTLNKVNADLTRIRLEGLDPNLRYTNSYTGQWHYGDELMNHGLITSDGTAGNPYDTTMENDGDFTSRLYVLTAQD